MKEVPEDEFPAFFNRGNKIYYLIGPLPQSMNFQSAFDTIFQGYNGPNPKAGSVMDVKSEMISPAFGRFSCLCARGDLENWVNIISIFAVRCNAKVWKIENSCLVSVENDEDKFCLDGFKYYDLCFS